jgi:hypothetical protein
MLEEQARRRGVSMTELAIQAVKRLVEADETSPLKEGVMDFA